MFKLIITVLISAALATSAGAQPASQIMHWQQLKIGAGGFLTGLDLADDGTKIARSDTNGVYLWDGISKWDQIVNRLSLPTADAQAADRFGGVWEIAIAPSNTNRFYMIWQGWVYRTDNRGAQWIKTKYVRDVPSAAGAHDDFSRLAGQKMAVDPANADVVYVGNTSSGVWVSNDAGNTWSSVASIPKGRALPGHAGLVFDTTSGTTDGRTNVIYIPSYGNGVWRTNDAGASWTKLTGGPTKVWHAQLGSKISDGSGIYYATDQTAAWKYVGDTWTSIRLAGQTAPSTIAAHPKTAGRIVIFFQQANNSVESLDEGESLVGPEYAWNYNFPTGAGNRVASDIPWLAWTNEKYMTLGDARFDRVSGFLHIAEGIGYWTTRFPINFVAFEWNSQSAGLEQLVPDSIASPPGGNPVFGVSDRGVFYNPNTSTYPSTHGPNNSNPLVSAWELSYSAGTPAFVVCLCNAVGSEQSGYSSDGGTTWNIFRTAPRVPGGAGGNNYGGGMAVNAGDISNIIWMESNNGFLFQSKNKGGTWKQINPPGIPTSGETGWGFAYYLARHAVAADQVTADTFYVYNYKAPGIYRSTDKGDNWTRLTRLAMGTGDGGNIKLRSVPGHAGHLFYTPGQVGNDGDSNPAAGTNMQRSTDGGQHWENCLGVLEAYDIGFGKAGSVDGYPTIFIWGWVNNKLGFWRSDDECRTWNYLGREALPNKNQQQQRIIHGDMNVFGKLYVGMAPGSGFAVGTLR